MTATDQALVARVLAGDGKAFAEIYQRHHAVLARRLRRVLGNAGDVEDVLQMTFVEAHRSIARYDPTRELRPWLHCIAFRQAAHHLRRARRRAWLRFGADAAQPAPDLTQPSSEDQVIQRELLQLLYRALDKLPANKRIAFTLHTLEGLGFTEIGEITEASPQTVRARVLSARAAILKQLNRTTGLQLGKLPGAVEQAG